MKYFRTTNATRLYRAGDKSFKFEPVALISSSWVGVYVADEDEAELLKGIPQISEIDEAEFNSLKKKGVRSMVQPKATNSKPEEKGKNAAVEVKIKDEVKIGKASYKDSLNSNSI